MKTKELISGIQQIGVGIPDVYAAKRWYRDAFCMAAQVFDSKGSADLMIDYTGGKVESRHAVLSLNMAGGGGMEIWQYTSKVPVKPTVQPRYGDLGIFACRIKSPDVSKAHAVLADKGAKTIHYNPEGLPTFWIDDPWGNPFQVVQGHDWFKPKAQHTGGVYGAVIGVSDIEKSIPFYRDLFGLTEQVYDVTGNFDDIPETGMFRRVLLRKRAAGAGAFGRLIGGMEIELVQSLDRSATKIFEGRHWGDAGFIHLCFDVLDIKTLKAKLEEAGHPFTVDSGETFEMGEGSGRFAYCEDPDGTLIEMVETHKVPIMKKIGWYLILKNRDPQKPLPDWMVGMLALSKVK